MANRKRTQRLIAALLLSTTLSISPLTAPLAVADAESSWLQKSKKDPAEINFPVNAEWDLNSFYFQLQYGHFGAIATIVASTVGEFTSEPSRDLFFQVNLDVDGDNKGDYSLSTRGIDFIQKPTAGYSEGVNGLPFINSGGQLSLECSTSLYRIGKRFVLNITADGKCLKRFPRLGIQVQTRDGNGVIDSIPSAAQGFLSVSTRYYDGWKCNQANRGLERRNLINAKTKYSTCVQKNSSWRWVGKPTKPPRTSFKFLTRKAVWNCELRRSAYVRLADSNRTLVIESGGLGLPISSLNCAFKQLNMPSWVRSRIGSTRALDGEKSASWSGYKAFWTYHPEDGLNMTVTKK